MAPRGTGKAAARERLLRFQQCEECGYDFASAEGVRSCHYYTCPYLPEQLDTVCPTCNYNFFTDDGVPGCGEPPGCAFAVEEAPQRVADLRYWLEHQPR